MTDKERIKELMDAIRDMELKLAAANGRVTGLTWLVEDAVSILNQYYGRIDKAPQFIEQAEKFLAS